MVCKIIQLNNWETVGGRQDSFFLTSSMEGWYKVTHAASNHINVGHSSSPFRWVQSFPVIKRTSVKRFSHMYRPLNYKKYPTMPNKSLQYFGTFNWTFCVLSRFFACPHLLGPTLQVLCGN